MKLIFNLILLISVSAQAQFFDWLRRGPEPQPLFSREVDQSFVDKWTDMNLMQEPIGKMIGRIPKNYEEIVNQGVDAPAEKIHLLHEKSEQYWTENRKDNSINSIDIDMESWRELNLRAAEVWKKLVACNSNNPEEARLRYFYSQKLCSDAQKNQEISQLLSELGLNFQQFLFSTPLLNIRNLNFPPVGLKHPHPLIVQFSIQQWSIYFNHAAEEKLETSSILSSILTVKRQNDEYRRAFSNQPDYLARLLKPIHQQSEILLKQVVNNLVFLALYSYEGLEHPCSIYGLWPAMNRLMLHQQEMLWNGLSFDLGEELKALDRKVQSACGAPIRYIHHAGQSTQGVYGRYGTTHIHHLRRLYYLWIGRSWERRK